MGDVAQKAAVAYLMDAVVSAVEAGSGGIRQAAAADQMYLLVNDQPNTITTNGITAPADPLKPFRHADSGFELHLYGRRHDVSGLSVKINGTTAGCGKSLQSLHSSSPFCTAPRSRRQLPRSPSSRSALKSWGWEALFRRHARVQFVLLQPRGIFPGQGHVHPPGRFHLGILTP